MLAVTSTNTLVPSKHDTAKKWLQRRLRKPASRQLLRSEKGGVEGKASLKRPQTAPLSGRATSDAVPPVPRIPIDVALPSPRLAIQPPSRPARPDSGVIRDVNAWLDASVSSQSPPLMGGLQYWRSASTKPAIAPTSVQYAVPIVREPGPSRTVTPSGEHVKSICRRGAKKVQAKMPSLLRTASQRVAERKQLNRRSASMPLLTAPSEHTTRETSPKVLIRSKSFLLASSRTSISKILTEENTLLSASQHAFDSPLLGSTRTSVSCSGTGRSTDQRMSTVLEQRRKRGVRNRHWKSGVNLGQDESLGDLSLSEAPTYSTRYPPPSYRSRAASIMTTSSFGCVDGMSPAQRQISQQRAATRSRGMRGRVKELRKLFQSD